MAPKKYKKKKSMKLQPSLRKAVQRIVKGNIETKLVDVHYGIEGAENLASYAGSTYYLSGVESGDYSYQRSGVQIMPTELEVKIMLRFWVNAPSVNTYWGNPMRVIIFSYDCSLDITGVPALPRADDIITMQPTQSSDTIFTNYNNNNRHAYTIMYDKVHVPQHGAGHGTFIPLHVKLRKNLPKKIFYSGNTNTLASAGRNAIFAFVCSYFDEVPDTTKAIYTVQSRLKYKDA